MFLKKQKEYVQIIKESIKILAVSSALHRAGLG